jgi:peroxiredoxin
MKKIFLIVMLLAIPLFVKSQEVGKEAPGFSGKTISGDNISLSDFKGKVTLIDVWASWCGPCKQEFPFLLELYDKYSDKDFTILAITIDEEKSNAEKFLKSLKKEVKFNIMFDPEAKVATQYDVNAIPSVYILDKKGVIRYYHLGFMDSEKEKYIKEIETLLSE